MKYLGVNVEIHVAGDSFVKNVWTVSRGDQREVARPELGDLLLGPEAKPAIQHVPALLMDGMRVDRRADEVRWHAEQADAQRLAGVRAIFKDRHAGARNAEFVGLHLAGAEERVGHDVAFLESS